jgi:hypothetical protein
VLVLGSAAKLLLCGFWVGVDLALILFFGDFRSSKRVVKDLLQLILGPEFRKIS